MTRRLETQLRQGQFANDFTALSHRLTAGNDLMMCIIAGNSKERLITAVISEVRI